MIFIDNKYSRWYYQIIEQSKTNPSTGYTEKHHIIPRCLGGGDTPDNLIVLSARQHFVCHRLLTKMTTGKAKSKMVLAVWSFIRQSKDQQRETITGRKYEVIRKQHSQVMSELMSGPNNPMYGKKHRPEVGLAVSRQNKGRKRSEETKQRMRKAFKTRPQSMPEYYTAERRRKMSEISSQKRHSEETKKKMSKMRKGKNPVWTQVEYTCEHCGKSGKGISNYNRWHGENCKEYEQISERSLSDTES